MKRYVYLPLLVLLLVAYFVPGEAFVQLGLRKIAIEQGLAQARRHHSWEAAADAEALEVAHAAPAPVAVRKPVATRGRR